MQKRALIAVISILALAIVAGGVWYGKSKKEQTSNSNQQGSHDTQSQDNNNDNESAEVDTGNWKTYRNNTSKLDVKYPIIFKINNESRDNGHVVSFMEFDEKAKNLRGQLSPGYFSVISIYYWRDINSPDLKGGSWENEKKYTNFQDFISDSEHTSISLIGETSIDGIRAYILSMPGDSGYEAVMFEYNGGYYRISFPWTQKKMDENIKKQFLSSIKLLK